MFKPFDIIWSSIFVLSCCWDPPEVLWTRAKSARLSSLLLNTDIYSSIILYFSINPNSLSQSHSQTGGTRRRLEALDLGQGWWLAIILILVKQNSYSDQATWSNTVDPQLYFKITESVQNQLIREQPADYQGIWSMHFRESKALQSARCYNQASPLIHPVRSCVFSVLLICTAQGQRLKHVRIVWLIKCRQSHAVKQSSFLASFEAWSLWLPDGVCACVCVCG